MGRRNWWKRLFKKSNYLKLHIGIKPTNEVTNENEIDLDNISLSMYDLVIVRNKINRGRQISENSKDLMFVIKNTNELGNWR